MNTHSANAPSARCRLAMVISLLLAGSLVQASNDAPEACRQVDLGLAYVSGDAFRYGRFTGNSDGANAVLNMELCRGNGHDAEGRPVWRLRARDVGLATPAVEASLLRQGRYRVWGEFDRLVTGRDAGQTPLQGVGGASLGLPSGWVPAATTAGMSQLLPSLGDLTLSQRRNRRGIGAALWFADSWKFEARAREDRKQGLRSIAGLMGNTGGNPRVIMLPEPLDQRTRLFDASLSHAGPRLQLRGGLHLSDFDNAHSGLVWQNPFAAIAGWAPSAGFPNGRGQLSLPPDNRFHQLSLGAGLDIVPGTRLNLDLAMGQMRQNQAFLPYTVDPVLAASVVAPLPRASLDGRIDTRLVVLRLASRPQGPWSWGFDYRFDERDNRSPRDSYVGIGGDSQAQDASEASGRRRINLPVSYREQRLGLNAAYRFGTRSDLRMGIERRDIDRTWSVRSDSEETRLNLGLRSRIGERFHAGLRWVGSRRSGSTYLGNRPFLDSHTPAYVDTVPGAFENLPGLRQYHLADRERSQWALVAGFAPSAQWNLGASAGWTRDDYRRSEFGLTDSLQRNVQLDASFQSQSGWSAHGFAGREWMAFDQAARAFQGGANRLTQAADPARNWSAAHRDRVDSLGLGVARRVLDGRVSLRADVAQSRALGSVQVSVGPALSAAPLPENEARIGTLDLASDFHLSERTSLRLGLRQERFRSADFATNGVGPNTLANVILLGQDSPDYRVHAILLSLRHRF